MAKFQVLVGVKQEPQATILTGRSGIGKTFLASTIPSRFFVCVERGLMGASPEHAGEIARFETPTNYQELLEMLTEFRGIARAGGHRHLVIDSLSGIEKLVNVKTCRQENVAHMESKDFKKVWVASMPLWQRVQDELDKVRDEAGAHVWLIAHSEEVSDSTDEGDMFAKWDLAFQGSGKSLSSLRQMWRAWADHVLFIDWDADITKGSIGKKAVGKYKARIIRTRETPRHYAKNRANLPPVLPATWTDLERALRAGAPASDATLRARITALLPQLSDDDRAAIVADVKAAKAPSALSAALSRAQGMISAARQDAEDDGVATPPEEDGESAPTAPPTPAPMPPAAIAQAARGAAEAAAPPDPEDAAHSAIVAEYVRRAEEAGGAEVVAAVGSEVKASKLPAHHREAALASIRAIWQRKQGAAA